MLRYKIMSEVYIKIDKKKRRFINLKIDIDTITPETLQQEPFSEELLKEVLQRTKLPNCTDSSFTFDDFHVKIVKNLITRIHVIVSRDTPR